MTSPGEDRGGWPTDWAGIGQPGGDGSATVGPPPAHNQAGPTRYASTHPPGAATYPPEPHPPGYGPPPYLPPTGPPREPGPPRRTHRWGLGAFLLVEAVFLVVSALIGLALLGEPRPPVGGIAVALLVPTAAAAGTALLATWLRGNGPRVDLGLEWSWRDLGLGLMFGFGGLFLTAIAGAVYVSIVGPEASSAVGDIFSGQRSDLPVAVLIFVIVVLIAPLCEEIVYRGLLWGALEKLGAGRWIAFAVTTVVFALVHFEFTRAPLLLVISIPIGLARAVTGRLLASIVAHQVNNLLPGVVLMLGLLGVVSM